MQLGSSWPDRCSLDPIQLLLPRQRCRANEHGLLQLRVLLLTDMRLMALALAFKRLETHSLTHPHGIPDPGIRLWLESFHAP